ncbi:hypothetical protein SHELI_v1c04640 [Spiroplasma helicoides]|uniref:Lipoprotein n=1 Tax=Spiroplasma helicoides TaxID=216938 RepID=A0A1B3SKI3_9MOLU|nr:hypothetical protein [Spiroplasma helicoides]AOG60415.1 hypothetical protein SHELI_v1c04640 [Spiroplasma helicoides]
MKKLLSLLSVSSISISSASYLTSCTNPQTKPFIYKEEILRIFKAQIVNRKSGFSTFRDIEADVFSAFTDYDYITLDESKANQEGYLIKLENIGEDSLHYNINFKLYAIKKQDSKFVADKSEALVNQSFQVLKSVYHTGVELETGFIGVTEAGTKDLKILNKEKLKNVTIGFVSYEYSYLLESYSVDLNAGYLHLKFQENKLKEDVLLLLKLNSESLGSSTLQAKVYTKKIDSITLLNEKNDNETSNMGQRFEFFVDRGPTINNLKIDFFYRFNDQEVHFKTKYDIFKRLDDGVLYVSGYLFFDNDNVNNYIASWEGKDPTSVVAIITADGIKTTASHIFSIKNIDLFKNYKNNLNLTQKKVYSVDIDTNSIKNLVLKFDKKLSDITSFEFQNGVKKNDYEIDFSNETSISINAIKYVYDEDPLKVNMNFDFVFKSDKGEDLIYNFKNYSKTITINDDDEWVEE